MMGCYVSSYMHAIPSLIIFFGENRVLKHPPPSASSTLFSYVSHISRHPYHLKLVNILFSPYAFMKSNAVNLMMSKLNFFFFFFAFQV